MNKGFTLIEILLVVGISIILFSLAFPVSVTFYRNQQLESVSKEITQNLRRAQLKSVSTEQDSSFGMYFEQEKYTLFKGDSFANRDIVFDELFNLPSVITIGGLSEIVFSKVEGLPNSTAPYCGGICTPCSEFHSRTSCRGQSGCSWVALTRLCIGNCTTCDNFIAEPLCLEQSGCAWVPGSIGGDIIVRADNEERIINISEAGRINLE